jgi:hypothetical protein
VSAQPSPRAPRSPAQRAAAIAAIRQAHLRVISQRRPAPRLACPEATLMGDLLIISEADVESEIRADIASAAADAEAEQ